MILDNSNLSSYFERAQQAGVEHNKLEPFLDADKAAEMRGYAKVWTIATSIGLIADSIWYCNYNPVFLTFPICAAILWKGFSIQHDYHADVAKKILEATQERLLVRG